MRPVSSWMRGLLPVMACGFGLVTFSSDLSSPAVVVGVEVASASPVSAPTAPFSLDPNPFTGVWNVAPTLGLDCTINMSFPYPPFTGSLTLRGFATRVTDPHRLLATPTLRLDFFGVSLWTLQPSIVVPLDQKAKTFGGSGTFATDTISTVVTGFGTVLTTAVISIDLTAGFSGPNTFTADLALKIVPRLRILGTWRTADCTEINGTFTATRAP